MNRNRYPDISDYGLIGDLQTAALVAMDGTVDWFCCPRFDSPSISASLLDADQGGYMRVAPATDDYVSRQLYFPDTAMLITRFLTEDGVGEVTDFKPIAGRQATDRHRLVRQLKVGRGVTTFVADIKPCFDDGRASHKLDITPDGFVFSSSGTHPLHHLPDRRAGGVARASMTAWPWSGSAMTCASGQRCTKARPPEWCWSRWAASPVASLLPSCSR